MSEERASDNEKTEVVQAVVPVSVADEIRRDARAAFPRRSVSSIIANVLCAYYAKRAAKTRRTA